MRMRGNVYWAWVDPALNHRSHEETLADGSRIDVQVRLSRSGTTQMFLGCMPVPGWHCTKRPTTAGRSVHWFVPWPGAACVRGR